MRGETLEQHVGQPAFAANPGNDGICHLSQLLTLVGLFWGALGAQLIECSTTGALDGQADVLTLGQFLAAVAAPYFIHCKPVSTVERR